MKPVPLPTKGPARNIAVLTDFSPCSSAALEHAIRLAKYADGKIYVIRAIEPWSFAYFPSETEVLDHLRRRAEENMARVAAKLEDVPHETIVEEGNTCDVLRHVIQAKHIELVVLGTIGIERFHNDDVLGWTAHEVVHQASCPVLSVGSELDVQEAFPDFGRIVYPTDFESSSRAAAAWAASMAERHDSQLALMHVIAAHRPPDSREAEWIKQPLRRRLRDVLDHRDGLSYRADCLVEFAEQPADAIVQTAKELAADLLVVGKIRRGEESTNGRVHKLGRILTKAPCPVLVVPESGCREQRQDHDPAPGARCFRQAETVTFGD